MCLRLYIDVYDCHVFGSVKLATSRQYQAYCFVYFSSYFIIYFWNFNLVCLQHSFVSPTFYILSFIKILFVDFKKKICTLYGVWSNLFLYFCVSVMNCVSFWKCTRRVLQILKAFSECF